MNALRCYPQIYYALFQPLMLGAHCASLFCNLRYKHIMNHKSSELSPATHKSVYDQQITIAANKLRNGVF